MHFDIISLCGQTRVCECGLELNYRLLARCDVYTHSAETITTGVFLYTSDRPSLNTVLYKGMLYLHRCSRWIQICKHLGFGILNLQDTPETSNMKLLTSIIPSRRDVNGHDFKKKQEDLCVNRVQKLWWIKLLNLVRSSTFLTSFEVHLQSYHLQIQQVLAHDLEDFYLH